jgi:hypothetical protein
MQESQIQISESPRAIQPDELPMRCQSSLSMTAARSKSFAVSPPASHPSDEDLSLGAPASCVTSHRLTLL